MAYVGKKLTFDQVRFVKCDVGFSQFTKFGIE